MIFGYKGVNWLLSTHCEQQTIGFEKSILGFVEEYTTYRSVHEETLKAPCGVMAVCFVNSSYCQEDSIDPRLNINAPDVDATIKSNADDCTANIFIKTDFTKAIGFSNKVVLKDDLFQCFPMRNGEFRFLFTGLGRKTLVESGW